MPEEAAANHGYQYDYIGIGIPTKNARLAV